MASYDSASFGPFMRVGVVGCGTVGRTICHALDAGAVHAGLAAVCDTHPDKAQRLVFELKRPIRSMSLNGLVASVDLVVEATNRHVAPGVMMAALNGGKDLLVTNVAAFFARDAFTRLAYERGLNLFAANCLLAGATTLNTAAVSPEARANLTVTCPRSVLADAPFLRGRELKSADEPQAVFQGEAVDAMAAFPAVANLIAPAAIAIGEGELLVRIHAGGDSGFTDIELAVSAAGQETTSRVRVPATATEAIHPEVVGRVAVGILRSLVTPLRVV